MTLPLVWFVKSWMALPRGYLNHQGLFLHSAPLASGLTIVEAREVVMRILSSLEPSSRKAMVRVCGPALRCPAVSLPHNQPVPTKPLKLLSKAPLSIFTQKLFAEPWMDLPDWY